MNPIEVTYPLNQFPTDLRVHAEYAINNNQPADVVFKTVKDGNEIVAHKAILEKANPAYFVPIFKNGLKRSDSDVLVCEINNISGPIFQTIINSIYHFNVRVDFTNCLDLFSAASQMHLEEIQDKCTMFMKVNLTLTIENCLLQLGQFVTYSVDKLIEMSVEFIFKHFSEVTEKPEFLRLDVKVIERLLRGSGIHSPNEEAIFEALKKWVTFNEIERNCFANQLINLIRIPLIAGDYFEKHIKNVLLQNLTLANFSQVPRKYESALIFVQQYGDNKTVILKCLDKNFVDHEISEPMKYSNPPRLIIHENNVFIFTNSVYRFNLITSTLTKVSTECDFSWKPALCYYNDHVYGFYKKEANEQNETLTGISKYNIKENKFTSLPTIKLLHIHSAAAFNDTIYIVEENESKKSPNLLKQLDINFNCIKAEAKMVLISGKCQLAVVNGTLYAIGNNKTIERFNSRDNTFIVLHHGDEDQNVTFQSVSVKENKIVVFRRKKIAKKFGCQLMEYDLNKYEWNVLWENKSDIRVYEFFSAHP